MSDEQPMYTDGEGNLFRSKHNAIAYGDLRKQLAAAQARVAALESRLKERIAAAKAEHKLELAAFLMKILEGE